MGKMEKLIKHHRRGTARILFMGKGEDKAAIKGWYRLVDRPEDDPCCFDSFLEPHNERTIERMAFYDTVLCIQDDTKLNFSDLLTCEGLGEMGANQTRSKSRGLNVHSVFAHIGLNNQ